MALRIGRSRLPELLKSKRMTQTELANRLSVSNAFISQVIHGKSYFSYELAMCAAVILDCSMEDLHQWHSE